MASSKNSDSDVVSIQKGSTTRQVTRRAFDRVWSKRGFSLAGTGGAAEASSASSKPKS